MRRRLAFALTILLVLGAVGAGLWRQLPDPLADTQAFLAPYEERGWSGSAAGSGSNEGYLQRRAWYADEARRFHRAFPAARGWTLRSRESYRPVVVAFSDAPSRLGAFQNLLRRVPLVGGWLGPPPQGSSVFVELSPARRADTAEAGRALARSSEGWSLVHIEAMRRPYPFRTAPGNIGWGKDVPMPLAPGAKTP